MEYSVSDLIRILLKKWYVILLTMLVVSCLALFLSQRSYRTAVAQYEALTTEKAPVLVQLSTLKQSAVLTFTVSDLTAQSIFDYTEEEQQAFLTMLENTQLAALEEVCQSMELFTAMQTRLLSLELQEPPLIDADKKVTPSSGPLVLEDHITAAVRGSRVTLSISGLEEDTCTAVAEAYWACLAEKMTSALVTTTADTRRASFTPDPERFTNSALFMQEVLAEPAPTPPRPVKVAGTAAVFSFVFAGFGVLLYTFVRDTAPSKKARGAGESA